MSWMWMKGELSRANGRTPRTHDCFRAFSSEATAKTPFSLWFPAGLCRFLLRTDAQVGRRQRSSWGVGEEKKRGP